MSKIILASGSPRRRELLSQVGISYEIMESLIEEKTNKTKPDEITKDLSRQKVFDVFSRCREDDIIILGADTIVYCNGKIMGKPVDKKSAEKMIEMLQNNTHQVFTGVTLLKRSSGKDEQTVSFYEKTDVTVYPISKSQIEEYLSQGEWEGKAGAYAIQGKFARFVKEIHGEYNTVVGLPIGRVCQELDKLEK